MQKNVQHLRLRNVQENLVQPQENVEINDEWWQEDAETNDKECSQVYAFIEIPLFAALISDNSSEPLYFVKIEEKSIRKVFK